MYFSRSLRGFGDADPCDVNPLDPVCQAIHGSTGQNVPGSEQDRPISMGPGTGVEIEMPTMIMTPNGVMPSSTASAIGGGLGALGPALLIAGAIIGVGAAMHYFFHRGER